MPVTAAQLAADEFLSNIIGSGIVVKEGCVQDVTLEAFEERCLASNAVPVDGGAKSMSILTKQFDACVEKRSKWDQMAFVESGTGGLRFVRTLKVSCQRGDIDAVEFLLPRDDKCHKNAMLGAQITNKPEIVSVMVGHPSLKIERGGLAQVFVDACGVLNSPAFIGRLLVDKQGKSNK